MKKLLIIVDPQVDFITGSLPVPGAEEAMEALARYVRDHGGDYAGIVVTSDRHPADHCSFVENGGEWPRHCVAMTAGAEVWPSLQSALAEYDVSLLYKGEKADREEYSIFGAEKARVTIRDMVRSMGMDRVEICGLAGDVCVAATARDAVSELPGVTIDVLKQFSPCIGG